jgi:hypothetical protein
LAPGCPRSTLSPCHDSNPFNLSPFGDFLPKVLLLGYSQTRITAKTPCMGLRGSLDRM